MAIHLFDGARAITGADPLSVYCDAYSPPWSWYDGPAAAHAVFQHERRRALRLRRQLGGGRLPRPRGPARGGRSASTAPRHGTARARRTSTPAPARASRRPCRSRTPRAEGRFLGLEGALTDFVAALRTGTVPQGECHDNLRSLAMCHAAVESAALGEPVRVLDRIAEVRR